MSATSTVEGQGRDHRAFAVPDRHAVLDTPLQEPGPAGTLTIFLGMGCFWGAEKLFWKQPGIYSTAVGYQGGCTPNPTYEEVCTGKTNHAEVVMVRYRPDQISTRQILRIFWENHDPTQGSRQGNDYGTQYRSVIYWTNFEQEHQARATADSYQTALTIVGYGQITSDLRNAAQLPFYFAEPYHQQYLAKNPHGYDCVSRTGIDLPPP